MEARVLQALIGLREGPAEAIGRAAGMRRSDLNTALNRLVVLSYVVRRTEEGRTVYRPVEQAL